MKDSQINIIRVFSAFAVVWLHVSAKFVIAYKSINPTEWWLANFADAYVRWCVPAFIMLTGALSLNKNIPKIRIYYIRKFHRIALPLTFWTIFYSLYFFYRNENATLFNLARNFAKGTPYYHLWYLYMLPGLYLITPFATRFISNCSKQELFALVTLSLGIAGLDHLLNQHNTIFITSFLPYIGYFLAGSYLAKYPPNITKSQLIAACVFSGSLIALLTGLFIPHIGNRVIDYMYGYLNPLVITLSLSAFCFLLSVKSEPPTIDNAIRKISPAAFGIYLIHPLFIDIINDQIPLTGQHPLIAIPIVTLLVFTISGLITTLTLKHHFLRKIIA